MEVTHADVSRAALFEPSANLIKGAYLHRDSAKLYKYDNTIKAVKITGKQLKSIVEKFSGSFYNQYRPGDVTISFSPEIRLNDCDMFAGVNYEINISNPTGKRIENLTYKGTPLKDEQQLVLALNSYRV